MPRISTPAGWASPLPQRGKPADGGCRPAATTPRNRAES
jgi:hypothetical protein